MSLGVYTKTILIRGARQLLTLRGTRQPRRGNALSELGLIQDGALLIRDGIVVDAGPSRRVENLAGARTALEISAAGRVVMPGFVDSHTHLVFPPPGGLAADEGAAVRKVRAGTGQRLEGRVRSRLEAMARHGTTTVEVKTGGGMDAHSETKMLRVLSGLGGDPLEVVPTVLFRMPAGSEGAGAEAVEWTLRELLPAVARKRLARFADVVWGDDAEQYRHFAAFLEGARGLGFRCRIHASGACAAAVAAALDHLVVSIDHLEKATPGEAAMLAGAPIVATLLPSADWRAGGPFAPAAALVASGAAVALASNFNAHHTPTLSMQTAIALAHREMGLSAEQAISAATINGAHALGCADRIGSIEPGKSADLVMLDAPDYRELAHHFGVNLVQLTMKRGEIIYWQGEVGPRAGVEWRGATELRDNP